MDDPYCPHAGLTCSPHSPHSPYSGHHYPHIPHHYSLDSYPLTLRHAASCTGQALVPGVMKKLAPARDPSSDLQRTQP